MSIKPEWKRKLKPASFRDIGFYVESSEIEGGRRTARHEFFRKDKPTVEDVGRKAKSFSFDAFVVGTSYMDARDVLVDALDQEGSGVLIHPYLGELTVQVESYRVKESKDSGGMAQFSLTFVETQDTNYPEVDENKKRKVAIKSASLASRLYDSIVGGFADIAGAVADTVSGVLEAASEIMALALLPLAIAEGVADELNRNLNNLAVQAMVMVRKPAELVYNLRNSIRSILAMPQYAKQAVNTYKTLFQNMKQTFDSNKAKYQKPAGGQSASKTQAAKLEAITTLQNFTLLTVASAAAEGAAVISDFESVEEATAILESVTDMFDTIIDTIDDDNIFSAALDVKIALASAIPPDGEALKNIVEKQVEISKAALLLTYEIYGNLDFETDIINRNKIQHPGIVPGGTSIKVLS